VTSVIAGATRPEQVEQNAKAIGWKMTPEEIAEVDKISSGK
jgi:aryl-alcohol dehydrogenase-like predicted oxidoreductase